MVSVIMELGDPGVSRFSYLNCYIKSAHEVPSMCRVLSFIRRMRGEVHIVPTSDHTHQGHGEGN